MIDHAYNDGQQRASECSNEELFATLEAGVLASVETQDGDRHGQQPQPLPEQRGGHEQLLHLQHEHIQLVEHLGGQLGQHQEYQQVMREYCPLQTVLILCPTVI